MLSLRYERIEDGGVSPSCWRTRAMIVATLNGVGESDMTPRIASRTRPGAFFGSLRMTEEWTSRRLSSRQESFHGAEIAYALRRNGRQQDGGGPAAVVEDGLLGGLETSAGRLVAADVEVEVEARKVA